MWWEHWIDNEMSAKIQAIRDSGLVKPKNGQLHINTTESIKPLWLHITGSTDCRNCMLWNRLFFEQLGIIHSFCRYHCWKTVCRPRNVRELIQYFNLMYVVPFKYNFINPIPGKAGIDVRPHTGSPYGAFSYALSLTEALRIKEIMTYMVTEFMPDGGEIDGEFLQDTIQVKRSCTEMEGKIPCDNPWWDAPQTRAEWEIEKRLEEIFYCPPDMTIQPAWVRDKVLQNWLTHANSIGDKSAVDFVGADVFNVKSRKYTYDDLNPLKGGDDSKTPAKKKEASKKNLKTKGG